MIPLRSSHRLQGDLPKSGHLGHKQISDATTSAHLPQQLLKHLIQRHDRRGARQQRLYPWTVYLQLDLVNTTETGWYRHMRLGLVVSLVLFGGQLCSTPARRRWKRCCTKRLSPPPSGSPQVRISPSSASWLRRQGKSETTCALKHSQDTN